MKEKIIFPKQKYAELCAQGFLERAFMWLNSDIDVGLFYAGLELRGCFEKIWQKHAGASTDDSDKFFNEYNWQPKRIKTQLHKELESLVDIDKSYIFTTDATNPFPTSWYYLAMPDSLFREVKNTNDFVHAQWAIPMGDPKRKWYRENHSLLSDLATKLIPHASSKNTIVPACMPKAHTYEIDPKKIEPILRESLDGIENSGMK
jgi:hypothetical protein